MPRRTLRFRLMLLAVLLLPLLTTGCRKHLDIPQVEHLDPIETPPTGQLPPIGFSKVVVGIRRGTPIGVYQGGISPEFEYCAKGEITWVEGRKMISGNDEAYADIFRDVFSSLGYNVVGDDSVVFDREKELSKAQYLIAARIMDIKMNFCKEVSSWTYTYTGLESGETYMKVEWSLYSNMKQKTVFRCQSEGHYSQDKLKRGAILNIIDEAFADAVANLGANRDFLAALSQKQDVAALDAPVGDAMKLESLEKQKEPFKYEPDRVLNAVVVVRQGNGHGSGYLISTDGHILTNAHVVGEADTVAVRFRGGLELQGKVLRSDVPHDVALVKVELSNVPALPVQRAMPEVASEVYAIGAPLDTDLAHTVTKGTVSAIRSVKEMRMPMIQADITIHPGNSGGPLVDSNGNVVGMCSFGMLDQSRTTMAGLNFFIPIAEALKAMNIDM